MSDEFSIKDVVEKTGVSQYLLRVWEQRYQWPSPRRNKHSGYRVYSQQDVDDIIRVFARVRAGERIGDLISDGKLIMRGIKVRVKRQVDRKNPDESVHLRKALEEARDGLRSIVNCLSGEPNGSPAWRVGNLANEAYQDAVRALERKS